MTDTLTPDCPQTIGPMTQAQMAANGPYKPYGPQFGRPTGYSPELAQTICDKLADGQSLASICREEEIPTRATVYNWLETYPDFLDKYSRVRSVWQAESLADNVLDISQTEDDPRKAQVQINAAIWVAGKLAPKKYGDTKHISMEHTHTLDDKQLDARIAALVSQAGETIDAVAEDITDLTPIEDKT